MFILEKFILLCNGICDGTDVVHADNCPFRCANGGFYVALGSSMGLALLVWVDRWWSAKVGLYFFGNEPSLGRKSPILHLPQHV